MGESLFSYLVSHFSTSPENLATEALCFILNQSASARTGFRNLLAQLNIEVPDSILFATQDASSEDHSIPDLVGKGLDGTPIVYAEAKFWAGLTENQPVTYLRRMEKTGGKALVFIAPAKRFPTLWPELQRRCADLGLLEPIFEPFIPDVKIMQSPRGVTLVLLSWRVLLNAIQVALQSANEREMESNLFQLQALCEKRDDSAFLPLTSEDLTGDTGKRITQYLSIVDEVAEKLNAEGRVSSRGYRSTSSRGVYVKYLRTENNGYAIWFSPFLWSKYAYTPIWLGIAKPVTPEQWGDNPEARERLLSFEISTPKMLFREDKDYYTYVPLFVEPGLERDDVVQSILQQFMKVFTLLEN